MNRIKNGNPSRACNANVNAKHHPPAQRNDSSSVGVTCFNCGKPGHFVRKCILGNKPAAALNAQANLTNEPYVSMITEIKWLVGATDG
jgi:hypothetical protein